MSFVQSGFLKYQGLIETVEACDPIAPSPDFLQALDEPTRRDLEALSARESAISVESQDHLYLDAVKEHVEFHRKIVSAMVTFRNASDDEVEDYLASVRLELRASAPS